jgi:hypothetical protein
LGHQPHTAPASATGKHLSCRPWPGPDLQTRTYDNRQESGALPKTCEVDNSFGAAKKQPRKPGTAQEKRKTSKELERDLPSNLQNAPVQRHTEEGSVKARCSIQRRPRNGSSLWVPPATTACLGNNEGCSSRCVGLIYKLAARSHADDSRAISPAVDC